MNKFSVMIIGILGTLIFIITGCKTVPVKPPTATPTLKPAKTAELSPVDKFLKKTSPVLDDAEGSLNPYVLKIVDAYPVDGSYPYRWEKNEYDIYNGVTQDLVYQEQTVAKAHPNGSRCSNCCGLTFEVFFRAMQLRNKAKGIDINDFNGMTYDDLYNFMLIWFVVGSGDSPQKAIEYYGLGQPITDWKQAKPGDFGDFSRNNGTGHSIIFIRWLYNPDGKIIGLDYFSSQKKGVGFQTELFSDSGGKVIRESLRLARVGRIEQYKPFDRTLIPDRKNPASTPDMPK
ncbi:MAG: hypothetical protein N3A72_06200 [bacterium]|nr:hypothetical protein [bacterium]